MCHPTSQGKIFWHPQGWIVYQLHNPFLTFLEYLTTRYCQTKDVKSIWPVALVGEQIFQPQNLWLPERNENVMSLKWLANEVRKTIVSNWSLACSSAMGRYKRTSFILPMAIIKSNYFLCCPSFVSNKVIKEELMGLRKNLCIFSFPSSQMNHNHTCLSNQFH